MCQCINVKMGSYDNQITLITPEGKKAGIDRCIVDEIKYLWSLKIKTIESCCGHNIQEGYIAVSDKDIELMKKLGYKLYYEKGEIILENIFESKTHHNKEGKLIYGWYKKDD